MGEKCNRHGDLENAKIILIGIFREKPNIRRDVNNKTDLREVKPMWGYNYFYLAKDKA